MNHRRLKLIINLAIFTTVSFLCYSILSVSEVNSISLFVHNTFTILIMLIVWSTCIVSLLYQLIHIRTSDKVTDPRIDQINQLLHQRLKKLYATRLVYIGLFVLIAFVLRNLTDRHGLLSIDHPLFGLFSETIFSTMSVIGLLVFLVYVSLYMKHRFSLSKSTTDTLVNNPILNQDPPLLNEELDRQTEDMKVTSRYKTWSYIALPFVAIHIIYIGLLIYDFAQGGGTMLLLLPFLLPFTFILCVISVPWIHSWLQYKNGI